MLALTADGDHLPEDAQYLLNQIRILASPPTNARNILVTDVYGRGTHTPSGEAWKQSIFDGLSAFNSGTNGTPPLNVAFGDFSRIWDGVLGTVPGYAAFGYTSSGSCLPFTNTTEGECDDPKHTFYWLHGCEPLHEVQASIFIAESLFLFSGIRRMKRNGSWLIMLKECSKSA